MKSEIKACLSCKGLEDAPRVTRGMGCKDSPILFVNQSPRIMESVKNKPLAGTHKQIMSECLNSIGLSFKHVYVINMLRCVLPIKDGKPRVNIACVRNCGKFTDPFLESDHVKIIVLLGGLAGKWVIYRGKACPPIEILAGKPVKSRIEYQDKTIFFTHHPSELISAKGAEDYQDTVGVFLEDFRALKQYVKTQQPFVKEWLINKGVNF